MRRQITFGLVLASIATALGCAAGIKIANNNTTSVKESASAAAGTAFTINTAGCYSWYQLDEFGTFDPYNSNTKTGGITFSGANANATNLSDNKQKLVITEETYNSCPSVRFNPKSSGRNACVAFYIPLSAKETISANSVFSKTYNFTLTLNGTTSDLKSIELFHFADATSSSSTTDVKPSRLYYSPSNTSTTNTGVENSIYRYATTASGITREQDTSCTVNYINDTSSSVTRYFHFALFIYCKQGSSSSSFNAGLVYGNTDTSTGSLTATVNDKYFSDINDAVTEYNSKSGSTLTLLSNVSLTKSITLKSYGGVLALNSKTLSAGSYTIDITSSMNIKGSGSITGTATPVIRIDTKNIFVSLKDNANIVGTSDYTLLMTAWATGTEFHIYSGSKLENNRYSCTACAYILGGTLINGGTVKSPDNSKCSIYYGESTSTKTVELYGDCTVTGYITLNTSSYLYDNYYGEYRTTNTNIILNSETQLTNNTIVVRGTQNAKFTWGNTDSKLEKDGSNLVYVRVSVPVTYNLTTLSTSGANTAKVGNNYSFTLTPGTGYYLPLTITITVGGTTLSDSQYTYDKDTGAATIIGTYVTDNIVIIAAARQTLSIQFRIKIDSIAYKTCKETIFFGAGDKIVFGEPTDYVPSYSTFKEWRTSDSAPYVTYNSTTAYTITGSLTLWAIYTQTDADKVNEFVGIKLHFDQDIIETSNNADTGACRGDSGFYKVAKTAYNALTADQKQLFCQDSAYANARARLQAWARANSETLDLTTFEITSNLRQLTTLFGSNDTSIVIIAVIGVISLTGLVFLLVKKRKTVTK